MVGLCFGTDSIEEARQIAYRVASTNKRITEYVDLIVDNKMEYTRLDSGIEIWPGDNELLEFSGWMSSLQRNNVEYSPRDYDIFMFYNDTLPKRSYSDGGRSYYLDYSLLEILEDSPWIAGFVDDFPEDTTVMDYSIRSWIRSNIFCMSGSALKLLGSLVSVDQCEMVTGECLEDGFWLDEGIVCERWKAYISSWLFGERDTRYPEYTLEWINASPLSVDTFELSRKKVLSILNEHLLTARARALGISILDWNITSKRVGRHTRPYYMEEE